MSKTTNINIFDFTTEQLNYLEQEKKKEDLLVSMLGLMIMQPSFLRLEAVLIQLVLEYLDQLLERLKIGDLLK